MATGEVVCWDCSGTAAPEFAPELPPEFRSTCLNIFQTISVTKQCGQIQDVVGRYLGSSLSGQISVGLL